MLRNRYAETGHRFMKLFEIRVDGEPLDVFYSSREKAAGALECAKRAYAGRRVTLDERHFVIGYEPPLF